LKKRKSRLLGKDDDEARAGKIMGLWRTASLRTTAVEPFKTCKKGAKPQQRGKTFFFGGSQKKTKEAKTRKLSCEEKERKG